MIMAVLGVRNSHLYCDGKADINHFIRDDLLPGTSYRAFFIAIRNCSAWRSVGLFRYSLAQRLCGRSLNAAAFRLVHLFRVTVAQGCKRAFA